MNKPFTKEELEEMFTIVTDKPYEPEVDMLTRKQYLKQMKEAYERMNRK